MLEFFDDFVISLTKEDEVFDRPQVKVPFDVFLELQATREWALEKTKK